MAKGLALEILKAKPYGSATPGAAAPSKGPADMMSLGGEHDDAGGEAAAQAFLDAIKSHDAKKLLGAYRSLSAICANDANEEASESPDEKMAEGDAGAPAAGPGDVDAVGKG